MSQNTPELHCLSILPGIKPQENKGDAVVPPANTDRWTSRVGGLSCVDASSYRGAAVGGSGAYGGLLCALLHWRWVADLLVWF